MFIHQILRGSNKSGCNLRMALEKDVSTPLLLKMSYTHFNKVFTLNNMDITQDINSKVNG